MRPRVFITQPIAQSAIERLRIDPAFLPRPLLMVARLPRNSTGKLPQAALRSLAAANPQSVAAG